MSTLHKSPKRFRSGSLSHGVSAVDDLKQIDLWAQLPAVADRRDFFASDALWKEWCVAPIAPVLEAPIASVPAEVEAATSNGVATRVAKRRRAVPQSSVLVVAKEVEDQRLSTLLDAIAASMCDLVLDTHQIEMEYISDNSNLGLIHRRLLSSYDEESRAKLLQHGLICTFKVMGTTLSSRGVWCLVPLAHTFCTDDRTKGMPAAVAYAIGKRGHVD